MDYPPELVLPCGSDQPVFHDNWKGVLLQQCILLL
jgi:hypothetical protein